MVISGIYCHLPVAVLVRNVIETDSNLAIALDYMIIQKIL